MIPTWENRAKHPVESVAPNLWDGLISAWSPFLGVTGASLFDIGGSGHYDGTLTNMALSTAWVTHKGETALNFIDTNDYVLVKSGTIAATAENCTVTAWFSTTTSNTAGGRTIYCERASSGNDIFKLDYGDNTTQSAPFITWRNDGGSLTQVRPSVSGYSDGLWHHAAFTISGTSVKLFIDGAQGGSGTISTKNFTNSGLESRIGSDKASSPNTWRDHIGGISIYNRALQPSEIRLLCSLGRGGIFQKRPGFVGMPVAGAGGPSSSPFFFRQNILNRGRSSCV